MRRIGAGLILVVFVATPLSAQTSLGGGVSFGIKGRWSGSVALGVITIRSSGLAYAVPQAGGRTRYRERRGLTSYAQGRRSDSLLPISAEGVELACCRWHRRRCASLRIM